MVAYFLVAAPRGPWPIRNGGGEALMHVVLNVYLALMGAGTISLDQMLRLAFARRTTDEAPEVADSMGFVRPQ